MQRLRVSFIVFAATVLVSCASAPLAAPARASELRMLTTTAFLSAGQSVALQCSAPLSASAVGMVLDGPMYRAASEELHGNLPTRLEVQHLACGRYVMACEAYDRAGDVLAVVTRPLRVTGECDAGTEDP